jgi:hypothetical protein
MEKGVYFVNIKTLNIKQIYIYQIISLTHKYYFFLIK